MSLAAALGLIYGLAVLWPNDNRLLFRSQEPLAKPRRVAAYDFLQRASEARLSTEDFDAALARLAEDPWVNAHPAVNKSPRVVQVSLGHPPEFFIRRRALYAPSPSTYEFDVLVPTAAVLTFHCGVLARGTVPGRVRFSLEAIVPGGGAERLFDHEVFSHEPFQRPRWKKLLPPSPALSQREAEAHWPAVEVDLTKLGGRFVKLRFRAEPAAREPSSDNSVHAFWGEPILWVPRPKKNPARDSVVLIVLNSLRSDELEAHGAARHTLSSLDSLARQGMDYQRFYTNAVSPRLALPSLLTSRRIRQIGEAARNPHPDAAERGRFYENVPASLVTTLREAGYRSAAMGPLSFMTDHPGPGVDWNFDELHVFAPSGYDTAQTFEAAEEWLARHEGEEPFLLVIYLGEAARHSPPPLYYWGRGYNGIPRRWADLDLWRHRAQLSYIDEYLVRFLQFLEDFNLGERCLISVMSTRGAVFSPRPMRSVAKDHAVWRSLPIAGIHLTEEETHAVWILKHRNVPAGRIFQKPAQLLDAAPTFLTLLGLPIPVTFQGSAFSLALKPSDQEQPLPILTYANGAKALLTEGHFKYIRRERSAEVVRRGFFGKEKLRTPDIPEELYDVWVDPNEKHNLVYRERNLLSLTRRVMDEVDPDPVETRLVFWDMKGQPVRGTVRLPGGEFRSFSSTGEFLRTGAYEYAFSLNTSSASSDPVPHTVTSASRPGKPGPPLASTGEVRFETWPPALSYVMQVRVNEKALSNEQMLFSSHRLPFLERRGVEWFDYNNFPWMEGVASPSYDDAGPLLFIGRQPSSAVPTVWEGPSPAADRSLWADPLLKTTEAGQLREKGESFDEP